MKRIIMAVLALAVGIGLTAAGWDNSAKKTDPSGTETIKGSLTGAAAAAGNHPVVTLTFRGPVNTTAPLPLGFLPGQGQDLTIKTAVGNLVIAGSKGVVDSRALLSASTCRFEFGTATTYTVVGSKSTGKFAGATGSGKAALTLLANLPKLSDGRCNESTNATPETSTAVATFAAAGPLTVK
jgi:hypothetical protein